jgi:transposase
MTLKLTNKQRSELLSAHRREKELRYGDRIKSIVCLDNGMSYQEVADLLLCSDKSIRNYEMRYVSGGLEALLRDDYQGKSSSLSSIDEEHLKSHLRSKLYQSAKEIKEFIKKTYKISYSLSGTHLLLERLGFVYKKPKIVPSKGDPKKQRDFIEEYEDIRDEQGDFDKVYFVDASHPQFNTVAGYGWIEKGTDVEIPAHTGRQRLNLNGALDIDTHETVVLPADSINAVAAIALFQLLEQMNPFACVIWVVLDNARYYRNKEVDAYLKTSRVKVLFLPPYSPNLNLIERVWKFFKREVLHNKYYEGFSDFKNAALAFFHDMHNTHRNALNSLLEENFHILKNTS